MYSNNTEEEVNKLLKNKYDEDCSLFLSILRYVKHYNLPIELAQYIFLTIYQKVFINANQSSIIIHTDKTTVFAQTYYSRTCSPMINNIIRLGTKQVYSECIVYMF